jgi:hypothetical protein
MTTGIIELNDAGVRVSSRAQRDRDFVESPGVAVVTRKDLLLGEAALKQSRLQPIETNTLFWHRLSAEPLALQNRQYRHHADLAYSHLLSLHEHIADCDEIIFALPGSFTRQQMSLLLGIVSQCPFDAVGLVDSAVAASAGHARAADVLHLDLQLHQCIFTHMRADGELRRQQVDVLPHCGSLTLRDRWAKAVADQFIDQSRFDPLHSAATEQSLYDQLPQWLEEFRNQREVFIEVGSKNIKMVRQQLVDAVEPIYKQLITKSEQLAGPDTQLLIGDRLAGLPGLMELLKHNAPQPANALPATAVIEGIHEHLDAIKRPSSQVSFVQALPVSADLEAARDESAPAEVATRANEATHVLVGHQAWPLGEAPLHIDLRSGVASSSAHADAHCSLRREGAGITLVPRSAGLVKISEGSASEQVISDNCPLKAGDTVTVPGAAHTLCLIEVIDVNGT